MKLLKIKKRKDFLIIQSSFDKKIHTNNFVFLIKKNKDNIDFCRFAPVSTKRVSKLAVIRNKIKRIIREIIRVIYKKDFSSFVVGFDYEIIAKKDILNTKFDCLYKEIDITLKEFKEKYGK